MQMTNEQMKTIGDTIRTIAANQSRRFFKSEVNTPLRSAAVFQAILSDVGVALLDAGIPLSMLTQIDPTDDVLDQMEADGYEVGDRAAYGGVPQ